jgi:hypothetical protein
MFYSLGKNRIIKVVEFTPEPGNIYNLGFGDLLPTGEVHDEIVSDNGDIIRVFSTIIRIVKDFLDRNPQAMVSFTGSTFSRTALYSRILRRYYYEFTEQFCITGFILEKDEIL